MKIYNKINNIMLDSAAPVAVLFLFGPTPYLIIAVIILTVVAGTLIKAARSENPEAKKNSGMRKFCIAVLLIAAALTLAYAVVIEFTDLIVYDYKSFEKAYGNEFYPYDGDFKALIDANLIVFWTWPGSGEYYHIFGPPYKDEFLERWLQTPSSSFHLVTHAYTDEDGREWGFIQNVRSDFRNMWWCLSDPANMDIPAFNKAPAPLRVRK